jgi:hypothetical protein
MEEGRKTVLIDSLNALYAGLSPSGDTEPDGLPAPGDD